LQAGLLAPFSVWRAVVIQLRLTQSKWKAKQLRAGGQREAIYTAIWSRLAVRVVHLV
jgi:hypothetical protein